jgi:4-hydroxybenzoate polyprenyltransferase
MKIIGFIRSNEWWEYKLTLFLFVGLLVILDFDPSDTISVFFHLLILLGAIVAGAVFVSLINDFTDLDEDTKAGKSNRLAGFSTQKSIVYIFASIALGILFTWYLWSFSTTILFYLGAWISFSLYSIPPFRLKTRGILGVFADAFGAHVFPTLFVLSGMFEFLDKETGVTIFFIVGVWAFSCGMRGILWHQFFDLDNDKIAGVKTFASLLEIKQIKLLERILIFLELISFILLAISFHQFILLALLGASIIYVGVLSSAIGVTQVLILVPEKGSWTIFMASFYQSVVPLTLIIILSIQVPVFLILIPVYLLLFPNDLRMNYRFVRSLAYQLKKELVK